MKGRNHKRGVRGKARSRHRSKVGASQILELLLDARRDLRAVVLVHGFAVFQQMLEEDRTAICGSRSAPDPNRDAYRHGFDEGVLNFGGRQVRLRKPRVRRKAGGEVELPTWSSYRDNDPLERRAVNQMILGVSTRNYGRSLEDVPETPSLGTERSSVSRAFVSRTETAVKEFLRRALSPDDYPVIMIDGKDVGGHMLLIVLGVDREGYKHVLGVAEGTTENSEVCRTLLRDLITRGFNVAHPRLVVLDGGKGLRKAVKEVFGRWALVQRCRVHKLRNVLEHLPKDQQATVAAALKRAWASNRPETAKRLLRQLAGHLRKDHPGAAGSIEEGLEETLTILRLGLTGHLHRLFSSTNMIENVNGTVQDLIRRVKRWRNGEMAIRWTVVGAMVAEKQFRRILGWKDMPAMIVALKEQISGSVLDKKAVNQ